MKFALGFWYGGLFLGVLITAAFAQEGQLTVANCSSIAAPTVNTRCIQTTTASGRTAGTEYRWSGTAWEPVAPRFGGCTIVIGSDSSATALTNTDLTQGNQCLIPQNATLIEVAVSANTGTPNITLGRFRPNGATSVPIVSAALATGASGAVACSRASAGTSINGTTSCVGTLQNTSLNAGDWIYLVSGTAGGAATRMTIAVSWIW